MFKKIISFLLAFSILMGSFGIAFAVVHVNGYYRKNGTYVAPHYRSDPDGIKSNNWSYPGNTNPYTGVTAGGTASGGGSVNYNSTGSVQTLASPSPDTIDLTKCWPSIGEFGYWKFINNNLVYFIDSNCKYKDLQKNITCPANSTLKDSACFCNSGYIMRDNKCLTYQQDCEKFFGKNAILTEFVEDHVTCHCAEGFQWKNDSERICITNNEADMLAKISLLKSQIQALQAKLSTYTK